MEIAFYKYQGTGNDFIIIDNRAGKYNDLPASEIKSLCDRRFGIGADGLILLNNSDDYDFEMDYYNADGKPGSMCGNGGRCIVRFAKDLGINKNSYTFLAADGPHEAEIDMSDMIRLKMKDVAKAEQHSDHAIVNTGSPHYIKFSSDVKNLDVLKKGREIRNSDTYKKEGINVNFVETIDSHSIYMRTYERGVEDETYSCGTGVTAAALMSAHNENGFNNVEVETNGGRLRVEFSKTGANNFRDIYLCGPATFVYKGTITIPETPEEKENEC